MRRLARKWGAALPALLWLVPAQQLQAQDPPAAPTPAEMRSRLAAMAAEEADRSTADRAIRSYYLHMNNFGEMYCLRQELNKAVASVGELPIAEFDRLSHASRETHFTDVAARSTSRFDVPQSFADCMRLRGVYSYEITEVETLAPDRVRYSVHATNTAPIPEDAPRDPLLLDMRAAGTHFRYELVKVGESWRIAQIEERGAYSSTYAGEWRRLFRETDRFPQVPVFVQSYSF